MPLFCQAFSFLLNLLTVDYNKGGHHPLALSSVWVTLRRSCTSEVRDVIDLLYTLIYTLFFQLGYYGFDLSSERLLAAHPVKVAARFRPIKSLKKNKSKGAVSDGTVWRKLSSLDKYLSYLK